MLLQAVGKERSSRKVEGNSDNSRYLKKWGPRDWCQTNAYKINGTTSSRKIIAPDNQMECLGLHSRMIGIDFWLTIEEKPKICGGGMLPGWTTAMMNRTFNYSPKTQPSHEIWTQIEQQGWTRLTGSSAISGTNKITHGNGFERTYINFSVSAHRFAVCDFADLCWWGKDEKSSTAWPVYGCRNPPAYLYFLWSVTHTQNRNHTRSTENYGIRRRTSRQLWVMNPECVAENLFNRSTLFLDLELDT